MIQRVQFWTVIRCESGVHAGHRIYVVAVRDQDDSGDFVRIEDILLEPLSRNLDMLRFRRNRQVKDVVSVGAMMEIAEQARLEFDRATRANRIEDEEADRRA